MKIKSLSALKESVNSNASLVFWSFNKKLFNVSNLIETVFLPLFANCPICTSSCAVKSSILSTYTDLCDDLL